MEESVNQLWVFCMWGFGICATGFFAMVTIVVKTSYDMTKPVREIRDALIGTYEQKGLITKHHELREDVDGLLEKIHLVVPNHHV